MSVIPQIRIIIPFAGRFPSEKAAALFVDLNARALVDAGAEVTILAPRRLGRGTPTQSSYAVKYLPTLDLSRIPLVWGFANFISVYVFAKFMFMWLLVKSRENDVIMSNDAWPLLVSTLLRTNTVYEMHDFVKKSFVYRVLLSRVRFVLVTNEWKRKQLQETFGIRPEKIILERNAVDIDAFGSTTKEAARSALGLAQDASIAVYTGHLYEWKGADTLAKAASLVPNTQIVFVGGAPADVVKFKAQWGQSPNIRIVGHVAHELIPLWQSAADVLVLPNSGKEEISVHYTSPMKLFEYMASERPIVASDLPSIREILPEDAGFYAVPDDPTSFADAIQRAFAEGSTKSARARQTAATFTWQKRAQRILHRII